MSPSTSSDKDKTKGQSSGNWLDDDPLGWELLDWTIENSVDTDLGTNIGDLDTDTDNGIRTYNRDDIESNNQYSANKLTIIALQHNENPIKKESNGLISNNSQQSPKHSTKISTVQPTTHNENTDNMNNGLNNTASIPNTQDSPAADTSNPVTENAVKFDGDTSRANPHFVPLLPAPIHQGESGRQLIMDTETTGLDASKGDRIVEVGIVEMVNRKFTGEKLHVYINPQRGMDEEVIRIHGISEAFLADKPTFDQVAKPLYDFMIGAEVIAHNAPFDISFLSMEFDKVGLTDFVDKIKVTDSLAMAKRQYPGQKNTLDALVRRLNVGKMDRTFHGALLDSEILAEVYLAMTGGQVSLAIDEDIQTEGNKSHLDFSQLADKLIDAGDYSTNHRHWVAKQIAKYPNLAQTQGISCYYKTEDFGLLRNFVSRHPINLDTHTVNLASNLFLADS